MVKGNINICFCTDSNIVSFIPVVINSILKSNKNHNFVVHVIHTSDVDINILERFNFDRIEWKFYNKEWKNEYSGLNHVSNATMLRIYIPDLIKEKKVIYLDIDIMVNMDLKELYDIDCGDTGIALKTSIEKTISKTVMRFGNLKSGNCGIMVMDLDKLRKNNFVEKCLNLHGKDSDGSHDQYLINMYCKGKYAKLKNYHNVFINQDDKIINLRNKYILHYAGSKKPWNSSVKFKNLWTKSKIVFGISSYRNSFTKFASSNIGDYVQSLAQIGIFKKIVEYFENRVYTIDQFLKKIEDNTFDMFHFVFVDRDNMNVQGFDKVIIIGNGWWMHPINRQREIKFNIQSNLDIVFVSFHIANNKLLEYNNIIKLKKIGNIGCRDMKTMDKLKNKGVDCYFSGCLTTTIDFIERNKENDDVIIVDTKTKIGKNDRFISHSNNTYSNIEPMKGLKEALRLLKEYAKCDTVYTSRLHCYLPCRAIGVNVNIIDPDGGNKKTWGSKDRFDGLISISDKEFDLMRNKLRNDTYEKVMKKILRI